MQPYIQILTHIINAYNNNISKCFVSWKCFRNHFGSVFYGTSFGLFEMIKNIIFNIFQKPISDENTVVLWACKISFLFSISSLQYVAMMAYTITILRGINFHESVKKAYSMILKKPLKFLLFKAVSIRFTFFIHYC